MATTFTSDDSLVLLIDHQVSVLQWVVQSPPRELVAQNAVKLANAAAILDIPLIISTNQEDVNGPLMPELIAAAPTAHEHRIQQTRRWSRRNTTGRVVVGLVDSAAPTGNLAFHPARRGSPQ